jgi:hypothetical protein
MEWKIKNVIKDSWGGRGFQRTVYFVASAPSKFSIAAQTCCCSEQEIFHDLMTMQPFKLFL